MSDEFAEEGWHPPDLLVEQKKRISELEAENRRMREALAQSLRQWKMYAEMYDETDLDKEDCTEAEMYRAARAALSQEDKP